MTTEFKIDSDKKIIHRTVTGEINTDRAIRLVQKVSYAAELNQGYNILVDIRDTTFHPEMMDLLRIADECSSLLKTDRHKIAFLIPDTDQRKQVGKLFRACMEAQGFEFMQFFDYDTAMEWLSK